MRICALASGSAGNCCCLEAAGAVVAVDCGLSATDCVRRMRARGFDPARLAGVLFTHNHGDHVRGVEVLHRRFPQAVLYANLMTAEAIAAACRVDEGDFAVFENGQTFEVGPFKITAFPIPHDVPDPVGYAIEAEGVRYFHCTDCGSPLASVGARLAEADVATLEANHDSVLLANSARPLPVKQRIAGARGHLSNDQAAELVRRFAGGRLRRLMLAHLSRECNAPHLARNAVAAALAAADCRGVELEILAQDEPGTVWQC